MSQFKEGYWYGSSHRPVSGFSGITIPNAEEYIVLTEMISDEKPYFDAVRTSRKLSNQEVYDAELTSLNSQSWLNIEPISIIEDKDDAMWIIGLTEQQVLSDVERTIRGSNKYANGITLPLEQIEQIAHDVISQAKRRIIHCCH